MLPALFKAHQDPIHVGDQHLRGETGDGVGLVDQSWHVQRSSRLQNRVADVAAGADGDVGLEVLHNLFRLSGGGEDVFQTFGVEFQALQIHLSGEAGDLDALEIIARAGNQLRFHPVGGTHEEHLSLRIQFQQPVGHGEGRVDVARGAAAGKQIIHSDSLFRVGERQLTGYTQ